MTENIFPSSVLFNCTNSTVCVELRNGITVVGTLLKSDGWMNLVLKNVFRFSADGTTKWKSPEVVIRGNSIKTMRVQPSAVKPRPERPPQTGAATAGQNESGQRRQRDEGGNNNQPAKMTLEERNKKYGKAKK